MLCDDRTVRLVNVAAATIIGAPLRHRAHVDAADFTPDGRAIVTSSDDGMVQAWEVPTAVEGEADRITAWVQSITGLQLDPEGVVRVLDQADWSQIRHKLDQVGGPPIQPTPYVWSRLAWHRSAADAAEQSRRWSVASWHLDRVIAAGATGSFFARRGLAHDQLGRPNDAATDYANALGLGKGLDLSGRLRLQLRLGDLPGYRESCRIQLEQLARDQDGRESNADLSATNNASYDCALGPDAVTDFARVVRLAEGTVEKNPHPSFLNTLGAVLYRSGRFREAIRQLNRSREHYPESDGIPQDWLFLAMAHHRLGEKKAARKWLERASGWVDQSPLRRSQGPAIEPPASWKVRLELQILLREARALIFGSPAALPEDVFAP
jgi:tetratricopeptide (TPR) repeat protein